MGPVSEHQERSTSKEAIKLIISFVIIFVFFTIVVTFYQQYEGWNLTDTMFFILATLATVGYGQPHPTDDNSRLFTIFFIIVGAFVIFAGVNDFIHNNLVLFREYFCSSSERKRPKEDLDIGEVYRYRKRLLFFILAIGVWLTCGAFAFKYNEDWTWTEAFYYAVETSATVGYGDLNIKHESTKAFICVYIVFSTIIATGIIRSYNLTVEENKNYAIHESRLTKLQAASDLYQDKNLNGPISSHQLLLDLLVYSGKLDKQTEVDPWMRKIKAFCNEKNEISPQDLRRFLAREAEIAKDKFNQFQEDKRFSWQQLNIFSSPTRAKRVPLSNKENDRFERMQEDEENIHSEAVELTSHTKFTRSPLNDDGSDNWKQFKDDSYASSNGKKSDL